MSHVSEIRTRLYLCGSGVVGLSRTAGVSVVLQGDHPPDVPTQDLRAAPSSDHAACGEAPAEGTTQDAEKFWFCWFSAAIMKEPTESSFLERFCMKSPFDKFITALNV